MALHTYTPTEWKNAPDHKITPINATNLNNIETGIENAYTDILTVRSDMTSISQTGSTASQAISAGTYFYLNGTLVRAKTDIASGATFTLNTNYEDVTAGGLNSIISNMFSSPFYLPNNGWVTDANSVTKTCISVINTSTGSNVPSGINAPCPLISIFGNSNIGWGNFAMGIQILITNSGQANHNYYRVKYAQNWYPWGMF